MTAPHATAEPWGAAVPREADLYELTRARPRATCEHASCTLPQGPLKVDIVVHHRGLEPVDGANVRVTLLQWIDPQTTNAAKWDDPTTWFTGNVPWTAAVNQVLNSADGKTALALDGGWSFVLGTSTESHRMTLAGQTLDSMHAGVATFDLDIADPPANTVVLLVAVIRTGTTAADDIALAPATLQRSRADEAERRRAIDATEPLTLPHHDEHTRTGATRGTELSHLLAACAGRRSSHPSPTVSSDEVATNERPDNIRIRTFQPKDMRPLPRDRSVRAGQACARRSSE